MALIVQKQIKSILLGFNAITPADSTTYYFNRILTQVPNATAQTRAAIFREFNTINKAILNFIQGSTNGSGESIEFYLYNYTDSIDVALLGSTTWNYGSNEALSVEFNFTPITLDITKKYGIRMPIPAMVSNPTNVNCVMEIFGY